MNEERIHQTMLATILGIWAIALIQGWVEGSLELAVIWGLIVGGISIVVYQFRSKGVFSYWSAHALQAMVALQIQVMHGMIAMHFGVFVALALAMGYRDPWVVLVGVVTVAVHHVLFNYLQSLHTGVYLFAAGPSWTRVLVHAAYAVLEGGILIYFAFSMRREQRVSGALVTATRRILEAPGQINLDIEIEAVDHPVVHDFRNLIQRIYQALGQTIQSGKSIASTLPQLRALSGDSLEQAEALSQDSELVASATEEMSSAIREVAANTQEVADLTERAWEENGRTQQSVERTSDAINQLAENLEKASAQVNELTRYCSAISSASGVINDIADQTNLLALNAAIEAARAGEQGRGFAVVADEVRQLAQRTQASTQEIEETVNNLIRTSEVSARAVGESVELAVGTVALGRDSRSAIAAISQALEAIRGQTQQIASAMQEQTAVSNDIASKVTNIDSLNGLMREKIGANREQLETSSAQMETILNDLSVFDARSAV